jgi:pimeloyl-ACP methyl ester carboxylesterase
MHRTALVAVLAAPLCLACGSSSGEAPARPGPSDGTGGATASTPSGGAGGASTTTHAGGAASSGGAGGATTGGHGGEASGGTGGAIASGGAGGAAACTEAVPGPPQAAPYAFTLAGQSAWSHDDGFPGGFFHTFDALKVAGPSDTPRKVHVFLPRDYSPCGDAYPVVYMNDGNTTFWPGGIGNKTWDVATSLGELWAAGAIPKLLVVAIEPLDREAEYTHTAWAPGHDCCGVEGYTAYVADAVKAFVDTAYHTRKDAKATAIVGSSHGGLAAFHMASRRPDVFGMAGCLSSSFWAGLDGIQGGDYGGGPLATSLLVQTLKGTLGGSPRPRLWIDWGLVRTGGFHNDTIEAYATTRGEEMVALLKGTYGYADPGELRSMADPIGEHDEVSWGRRFPLVMKAFFGP